MNKKNLCILPLISLDRNADTSNPSFAPCCLYQSKKEFHDFDEYWSSSELADLKKEMLNGKRPSGCWKCWHDEDAGKKSMRQSVNESRLEPHVDYIEKDFKKPLQVKLLAGASCNLACIPAPIMPAFEESEFDKCLAEIAPAIAVLTSVK